MKRMGFWGINVLVRTPGIGLDVGSKKIKLAQVKVGRKGIQIINFDSIATPPGAVEAGIIVNPGIIGEALREMVRKLKLQGKGVISAISGHRIYIRNLILPQMKLDELKKAAAYQALEFLPIPMEEAAIDVCPIQNFEDKEGKKTEVFFVAVPQQQVDSLETICHIAGLKLRAVEIEPLALYRLMGTHNDLPVKAFLQLGDYGSALAVFNAGILTFYRSLSLEFSASNQVYNLSETSVCPEWQGHIAEPEDEYSTRINYISTEISRSVEYYQMQNEMSLDEIILCGGEPQIKNVDISTIAKVGCTIKRGGDLPKLVLPSSIDERTVYELKNDFLVALGLAMREVV